MPEPPNSAQHARLHLVDSHIERLVAWLSKPAGFVATCFVVAAGLGAGIVLSFNDHWALVFNLFLSIAALLMAGIILVAGAKDTSAIQAKLDELIRAADEADDRLIGIDQRSLDELKKVRVAVGPINNEQKPACKVN